MSVTIVFHGNVEIDGNLTINGDQTVVNVQSLNILDKEIVLGIGTTPGDETDFSANGCRRRHSPRREARVAPISFCFAPVQSMPRRSPRILCTVEIFVRHVPHTAAVESRAAV